jgi:uncharacterized iron-regulated membrane protein
MSRATLYLTLRKLHLWISLVTVAPLLVLSVTGALLVFGPEMQAAFEPESRAAGPAEGRAPITYRALLDAIAEAKPEARVWSVGTSDEPDAPWTIWLSGDAGVLNVDPYTGRILKDFHPGKTAYGRIAALHRWLLVAPGEGRRWVRHGMSAVTLLLIVQVVLGLWVWALPARRLQRLKPDFSQGARQGVLRLHNLCGVLTAALVALIAFTGMTLFWHGGTRAVIEALTASKVEKPALPDPATLAPLRDLDAAIALGRSAVPDLAQRSVRVPARPGEPVMLRVAKPGGLAVTQVWVGDDPPRVLTVFDPAQGSAATAFWHMRSALHAGEFWGWPVGVAWVLLSLAPSGFVISGLWLYWKRRGKGAAGAVAA